MTKRILIVDDDDDIREATQICLEVVGDWDVLTASSGKEGLSSAIAQRPDLILLDVMMPDMDGFETFTELQANLVTRSIPVILLTAKAQPAELRQFTRLQVSDVITKPYTKYEVLP